MKNQVRPLTLWMFSLINALSFCLIGDSSLVCHNYIKNNAYNNETMRMMSLTGPVRKTIEKKTENTGKQICISREAPELNDTFWKNYLSCWEENRFEENDECYNVKKLKEEGFPELKLTELVNSGKAKWREQQKQRRNYSAE